MMLLLFTEVTPSVLGNRQMVQIDGTLGLPVTFLGLIVVIIVILI